jgi:hypothetical protein
VARRGPASTPCPPRRRGPRPRMPCGGGASPDENGAATTLGRDAAQVVSRSPLVPRKRTSASVIGWSAWCLLCCKTLFGSLKTNFPSRGCGDRIITWGTTPPCVKLTGDSGNGFEAALIGDCRLFRLFAENYSHSVLGLLQHNPLKNRRRQPGLSGPKSANNRHRPTLFDETIGAAISLSTGPRARCLAAF